MLIGQEKPSILPPAAPQLVRSLWSGAAARPCREEAAAGSPPGCQWSSLYSAGGGWGLLVALLFPTCRQCGLSAGATEGWGWGNLIGKAGEAVSPRREPRLILSSGCTAETPLPGGTGGSQSRGV